MADEPQVQPPRSLDRVGNELVELEGSRGNDGVANFHHLEEGVVLAVFDPLHGGVAYSEDEQAQAFARGEWRPVTASRATAGPAR